MHVTRPRYPVYFPSEYTYIVSSRACRIVWLFAGTAPEPGWYDLREGDHYVTDYVPAEC